MTINNKKLNKHDLVNIYSAKIEELKSRQIQIGIILNHYRKLRAEVNKEYFKE